MLLAILAGCSGQEGYYRLYDVLWTFDPQPTLYVENTLEGEFESVSVPSLYAPYEDESGTWTTYQFDTLSSGVLGELFVDGDAAAFLFGTALLEGSADGDGWRVRLDEETEYTIRTDYAGGFVVEQFQTTASSMELYLVVDGPDLAATGTVTTSVAIGERSADTWEERESEVDTWLTDVPTRGGDAVVNRPDRDDCAGEWCESAVVNQDDTYQLAFDGLRIAR